MTKDHAQGVFIRFIDFRGELLLRASAIDGVAPAGKNGANEATYVYLNGTLPQYMTSNTAVPFVPVK